MSTTTRSAGRLAVAAICLLAGVLATGSVAAAHERGRDQAEKRQASAVNGVVIEVASPNFSIERRNGSRVVVATNDSTSYAKTVHAAVADATTGEFVVAKGESSDDGAAIHARHIHIFSGGDTADAYRRGRHSRNGVAGRVLTNDGSTLTVAAGDQIVTVTTDADTRVKETTPAGFGDLAVGQTVHAAGQRTGETTFAARRVHIHPAASPEPKSADGARPDESTAPPPPPENGQRPPAADETSPGKPRGDVRTKGMISAIDAPAFTLERGNREGPVRVVTNDATTFVIHRDDTTSRGSFADLRVGDGAYVEGTVTEDGALLATRVFAGGPPRQQPTRGDHPDPADHHDPADQPNPSEPRRRAR